MVSTPATQVIGIQKQGLGDNINTWGDTKLNDTLETISRAMKGWNATVITGDTTVSETNYSTTNATAVPLIRLTSSTITAAFSYTIPSRANYFILWNATSYACTVKLAASSGFSLPSNRIALVATDGSADVYNVTPNFTSSVTLANTLDVATKTYVDTGIAGATTSLTSGTVFVDAGDTTAKYLDTALLVSDPITKTTGTLGSGSKSLTFGLSTSLTDAINNLAGTVFATLSTGTTTMTANRRYRITGAATATLSTLTSGQWNIVEFAVGAGITGTVARGANTIDGVSEDDTYIGDGTEAPVIRYDYASAGAVTSRLIEGIP